MAAFLTVKLRERSKPTSPFNNLCDGEESACLLHGAEILITAALPILEHMATTVEAVKCKGDVPSACEGAACRANEESPGRQFGDTRTSDTKLQCRQGKGGSNCKGLRVGRSWDEKQKAVSLWLVRTQQVTGA